MRASEIVIKVDADQVHETLERMRLAAEDLRSAADRFDASLLKRWKLVRVEAWIAIGSLAASAIMFVAIVIAVAV